MNMKIKLNQPRIHLFAYTVLKTVQNKCRFFAEVSKLNY